MTKQEFISRPHFCIDEGVPLPGLYGSNWSDKGYEVVPAGGTRLPAERRTTATKDAAANLRREVEILKLAAKMDRLIELMTKRIKAENAAPKKKAMDQQAAFDQMAARSARACAEAREAYAARNPHRNDRGFV